MIEPNESLTETVELSWEDLVNYRKKFPVAKDADQFEIKR